MKSRSCPFRGVAAGVSNVGVGSESVTHHQIHETMYVLTVVALLGKERIRLLHDSLDGEIIGTDHSGHFVLAVTSDDNIPEDLLVFLWQGVPALLYELLCRFVFLVIHEKSLLMFTCLTDRCP